MMGLTELKRELDEKNYAELPFALSRKELEGAAEKFFAFLSLPQEEKEQLHFFDRPENRQGLGYTRKNGTPDEVGRMDYKEFFHYHPQIEEEFAGSTLLEREETKAFLAAAKEVHDAALHSMRPVTDALTEKYPNADDTIAYTVVRFLKYEPGGKGSFLARAHYDRGCLTLALAESAPGLRIGKNEATLKEVVHQDGIALFMPAYQVYTFTNGEILPAWHDVVQSSEDTYRADAARWAIVFFTDAKSVPVPPKTESHTPVA